MLLQLKNDHFLENFARTLKNSKSVDIIYMIINTEKLCDLFELLQVDCVMEIFLLGTSNEYRRQGIAEKLCRFSVEVAQKLHNGVNVKQPVDGSPVTLEPVPQAVTAIFSSPVSQRIGRKLGLQVAAEHDNSKVELKDRVLEIPGETTTTTLEYKKLVEG